jgi:prepilin-type processing-associated H-X9-DG protein
MFCSKGKWRVSGFTLLELLVVITIIMLLLSITLPSFSSAREMARGITCSNNIRQFLTVNYQYSMDHHDTWPGRGDNSVMDDYDNTLCSWVPCGDARDSQFDIKKGVLFPLLKNPAIYRCPSDPAPSNGLSYSINANIYSHWVALPSVRPTITYPKPDKFTTQPDKLVIFVDESNNQNDGNFKPIRPDIGFGDEPSWRHNKKAGFGFFDNHVELRRYDDPHISDHNDPGWYPEENGDQIE